jgi:threonylcarbamoyladenosine tRNA methylthiotransferase MtaB
MALDGRSIDPSHNTSHKPSYWIQTFGCKLNTYDSEALEGQFQDMGFYRAKSEPDLVVINTCTVTHGADRQCLKEFRRIWKKWTPELIVITGCLAETNSQELKRRDWQGAPVVVVGNRDRSHIEALAREVAQRKTKQNEVLARGISLSKGSEWSHLSSHGIRVKDDEIFSGLPPESKSRTRGILKIQEGCEVMCSFCIIPLARGRSRSRGSSELIEEIKKLEERGIREVVITGTHIPDYRDPESDANCDDLLELLLKETSKIRFRMSSLEPPEVSDRLLNLMVEEDRVCPHLHLSLQSTETGVLEQMNRRYGREEVEDGFERIYRADPSIFIGMDLITCFPGETDTDHQNTLDFLSKAPWDKIHLFPYSSREGTAAAYFKDHVKDHIRRKRIDELLALSDYRYKQRTKDQVGKTAEALVESIDKKRPEYLLATTERYWKVRIPKDAAQSNQICRIRALEAHEPGLLLGEVLT